MTGARRSGNRAAPKAASGAVNAGAAGRLWKIGHGGGHAISLISVTGDGSKFVYNDTGAGVMKAITADELSKCLIPARINVTKNIVR